MNVRLLKDEIKRYINSMLYLVFNAKVNLFRCLIIKESFFLFDVKLYGICFRFKNKKLFFLLNVFIQADKVMIKINVAD